MCKLGDWHKIEVLDVYGAYDPDTKPVNGKLSATCNGCDMDIFVSPHDVEVKVHAPEGFFTLAGNLSEPGAVPWCDILRYVEHKLHVQLCIFANNQRAALAKQGVTNVH